MHILLYMYTKFRISTPSQRGDLFSELHHNYIIFSQFGFATWDVMRVVKGRKNFKYFRHALFTYAAAHSGAFIAKVWLLHKNL